jgi:outer membrane protein OmpU
MKKELLGSTIIVASTLLFAMPVAAAEKPTISFSGYTRAEVSFVDQDLDVGRKRGYHFETDENYLNWTAKGTADNGLTYSATAKMEFKGGKDTIGTDEAYLTFGGEWGTVVMGDDDGADDIMMVGGYSLLTAGFGYDGGYGSSVNFSSGGSGAQVFASLVGDTGDATKVSYFTPRWSGLQLGASWTPDSGHTFDAGLGGSKDNDGSRENNLGLGINYNQTHGDVGIKFGATYGTGEFEDTAAVKGELRTRAKGDDTDESPDRYYGAKAAASGGDKEDISAWSIGGNISYAGFSAGVGHGDSGDSGCAKSKPLCDAGEWWDIAVQYKFGTTTVATGFLTSEGNPGGDVSDTEIDVWTLGVSHNFSSAPGLRAWAEITNYQIDREGENKDNDANYFMIGTQVAF